MRQPSRPPTIHVHVRSVRLDDLGATELTRARTEIAEGIAQALRQADPPMANRQPTPADRIGHEVAAHLAHSGLLPPNGSKRRSM
ncbi:hypothetical protein [Rhizobium sp. RAF56]|jgi:hypothetical protein|uniref:hypothetical protein n=1 Tax=Rhizobium sp. RAF56 TaxID=3233062 RepID=UPI003F9CEB40